MKRSRRIAACLACLPILLLPAPAAEAQKASFSCDGATRLVDRMLCMSGPLNSADHALAQRYKEAMAALPDAAARDALRAKQRQWLAERDRRCIGTLPPDVSLDGPAASAASQCLEQVYVRRIVDLQNQATPPLALAQIQTMPDQALRAAYPPAAGLLDLARSASYASASFAPDGSKLALSISNIVSGDSDQVWVYDLARKSLAPASPQRRRNETAQNNDVAGIQGVAWDSQGVLHVKVLYRDGQARVLASGAQGSRMAAAMPPARPAWFNPQPGQDAELVDEGELYDWSANRRFAVRLVNRGHGSFLLQARSLQQRSGEAPWQKLASGSWELTSFVFDPQRDRVLYPASTGLIAANLASGRQQRIAGTAVHDQPLDYNPESGLLAWTTSNPCGTDAGTPQADGLTPHVCIGRLLAPN